MIHYICALRCEATPLIDACRLNYLQETDLFSIYVNDQRTVSVTVTGTGKLAMSAAVTYTWSCLDCTPYDVWLNVGIAGHRDHEIGDIYLGNHVQDAASTESWYPRILIDTDVRAGSLLTLDRPSTDYTDVMFDMEASGFISAARRFGAPELVHCLKIISDNQANPDIAPKPSRFTELVNARCKEIRELAAGFEQLADELRHQNGNHPHRRQQPG